ncbi:four-carbon acid sugar kinase family protein [Lysobacter korlensis]|uniref:Four-carbon acid sugar kinase family protein n=1 Tax=Lysobacter korlensis TaxID=553636 RepID=A0ABV6RU08_9GAMM
MTPGRPEMLTVVLDDDPTGTQSATDVTVLLSWDVGAILDVLRREGAVYLQTNSRALSEPAATELARSIRADLRAAESLLGERILVVLRGDSTLRGHVFAESDVFADAAGPILFVPAFPAGGRTTLDGVHRVRIDGVDRPVAETEFARDPVFGYRSSDLRDWVREVGRRSARPVPLRRLRDSAGAALTAELRTASPDEVVVPDAVTDDDLRLISRALLAAIDQGASVAIRCAATLAAICAGRLSDGYLPRPIGADARRGVVVVCGSHTAAASEQLEFLLRSTGDEAIVIPTDAALESPERAGADAAARARARLEERNRVVLATERSRRETHNTLAHGERVMRALTTATTALLGSAGVLVSKGGITSAEVARLATGGTRAHVRGQLAPGISVWDLESPSWQGTQVVVPGNVGGRETLVDVLDAMGSWKEAHG